MRARTGIAYAAAFLLLISATFTLTGCAALIVGGAIGYEVSPDSVKADFDTSMDRAYDVSMDVVKSTVGPITTAEKSTGWVKSDAKGYNVAVHLVKLTEETIQVTVSARKYATPRVQFARDILAKISKKLK